VLNVPADFEFIQEAVDAAAEGDTILVAPGTYDRTWSRQLHRTSGIVDIATNVLIEVPLVLSGQAGAQATVVRGSGLGPVITIAGARGVVLEGLTISGGAADETVLDGGGGVYCELSDVEVSGCVIEDNAGPFGAGIGCFTASGLWVHDSEIRGNGNCEFGGGISLMVGSAALIESSVFSENTARIYGGAMIVGEQSTATIENNTIVKNSATSGSGIFCRDGSEVDVALNIFGYGEGTYAVYCDTLSQGRPCVMNLVCNDFWDSSGGAWAGPTVDEGNRITDPYFCSPETGDYTICAFSPSAGTGDACGRRGALPAGCYDCPVGERRLSWGALKALY
jgi:hypothetical protein